MQLEKQWLLDRLVAAGAPGVAAWVQDEHGSLKALVAWPISTERPIAPVLHILAGNVMMLDC